MAEPNGNTNANPNTTGLAVPKPHDDLPYSLSTLGVHADDPINNSTDVAPALHLSTTFRYSNDPSKLQTVGHWDTPPWAPGGAVPGDAHIYSRATAPNTSRLELILTELLGGPALSYGSGLAAFHALIVFLHPKVVAIGAGYHGCHGVLKIYQRLTGCRIVDLFDESSWGELGKGDVVHLETPVNPTGRAFSIEYFSAKAKERGAVLTIDATFAPPPLQDPFKWGADFVMHSGTKYFGGHSDMLCGVLAVNRQREGWERDYWGLFGERIHLGAVMGSLEGWLGVRSLRTLELRVLRQSENADKLVAFLNSCLTEREDEPKGAAAIRACVREIHHASLQTSDLSSSDGKQGWLAKQMPNGFGPVFAISMKTADLARTLPSKLHLFHHATSLGGVESLVEWRRMSDATVEEELVRVSVGVENWEDLRRDVVEGCEALVKAGGLK